MLIGSCVATALLIGSLATACADEGSGRSPDKPATTSSSTKSAAMGGALQMARQAPVGHRQPRAIDVPLVGQTPAEAVQRQQDREIDRKLLICRGC